MPRTIRLVLVGAAVAASIIPTASPAIAETGATDVTIVAQADAQDGNVTQTVPVGGGHSAGILDQTGLDAAAPAALLAAAAGVSGAAWAAGRSCEQDDSETETEDETPPSQP